MKKSRLRVVADTNVIVSALNFGGNPGRVIALAGMDVVELYLSKPLLSEVAGVLRSVFAWSPTRVRQVVKLLTNAAVMIQPTERVVVARDEDDNRILECAIAAHADYLISGDKDLLVIKVYAGVKIVSPAQFLALLRRSTIE